jgi:Fic family protein
MSDEEVLRLLRGLKSRAPKNRDEQEVAGYADLLGRIFDNYKTLKITEGQILQFHKILLDFSEKEENHKGKYKSKDNIVVTKNEKGETIVLFRPTPPYLVKKEMDDILFWLNQEAEKKEIHPLLIIANFIFEFLAIHPFEDGNGRLSRALTNLLLLKFGYSYIPYVSLEEIIEDNKIEYYFALRTTQKNHKTKNEDISPWVKFLLKTLIIQTQKAQKILQSESPEKLLSEKQIRIFEFFRNGKILSVSEIDKKLKNKIPQITIKQALSRLVKLNLLERIGQGRGTRYKKKS